MNLQQTNLSHTATATGSHVCNCIGCCRRCGSCRTAPWHTPAYCAQRVRWLEQCAVVREA